MDVNSKAYSLLSLMGFSFLFFIFSFFISRLFSFIYFSYLLFLRFTCHLLFLSCLFLISFDMLVRCPTQNACSQRNRTRSGLEAIA